MRNGWLSARSEPRDGSEQNGIEAPMSTNREERLVASSAQGRREVVASQGIVRQVAAILSKQGQAESKGREFSRRRGGEEEWAGGSRGDEQINRDQLDGQGVGLENDKGSCAIISLSSPPQNQVVLQNTVHLQPVSFCLLVCSLDCFPRLATHFAALMAHAIR
jgi:hypothetical protein